jgi:hypothetical protein
MLKNACIFRQNVLRLYSQQMQKNVEQNRKREGQPMSKMFTRTMTTTKVRPFVVSMVDGKIGSTELESIVIAENATEDAAIRACKAKYGKKQQYAVILVKTEKTFGMTVEKFMEGAVEIPTPVKQVKMIVTPATPDSK